VDSFGVNTKDLSDFFSIVNEAKKVKKIKSEELIGDSFEELFWSKIEPKKEVIEEYFEDEEEIEEAFSLDEESTIKEESNLLSVTLSRLDEGLLNEPPSIKNSDPLTPLDKDYKNFESLQKQFQIFVNRVQEQLATLGGGGETNLTYMDVPITSVTTSSYTIKPQDYYIGVNYAGAVTITLPKADREGKIFVIKDELGEASKGTNRYITILPSGTDLIDGRDRAILAFDYGSLTFIWKGNSWRVI
jgi:hypothetical protein